MTWVRRWLARLGKLGLVLIVLAVLIMASFFASLPEIVRQVVVRQVPKAIGRPISIEDIDLNLFTGRIAVKKLRLGEREGRQTFVEFERLEARLGLLAMVRQNIRIRDLRLVGPVVRIVRGENGDLNFQDLLPGVKKADVARTPSKWTFALDHAAIERGRVIVEDRAVSPPADWSIQDLALETSGVSTKPDSPPGWLKGSLRMGTAALALHWDKFSQAPVRVQGGLKLTGFDLTRIRPYLPPAFAGAFASGTVGVALDLEYTRTDEGLQSARANGNAAVEKVAVVKPGTTDALVGLGRLGVGLKRFDLEQREVTLESVELSGFDVGLNRDKSGQIDLIATFQKPDGSASKPDGTAQVPAPESKPSPAPSATESSPPATGEPPAKPWQVHVEQLKIDGAKLAFTDESVNPAVKLSAVLGAQLAVEYVPTPEGKQTVGASGDVTVSTIALERPASKETLVALSRLAVGLKRFDLAGQEVTLSRVELTGLDAKLRRDKSGQVDLVAAVTGPEKPASPAPRAEPARPPVAARSAPVPQPQPWKIAVERTKLTGKAQYVDETVAPPAQLPVNNLDIAVDNFTWPVKGPAALTLSASTPGSGTLKIQGPVIVQPFDAQLSVTLRDAAIEPYQSFIPVNARLAGRFNGDSKSRIAFKDGKMILASKGSSWADKFEARLPGAENPMIAIERMDLVDIDFDWPTKATVAKAGFQKPVIEIERGADGVMNVTSFVQGPEAQPTEAKPAEPAKPEAKPETKAKTEPPTGGDATPGGTKPPGLLETMKLEFSEIRLEEGTVRFIDRTTEPAFSEDLSKMNLVVTGLSNQPDSRAKLVFTTVIGGDAGLDIRGDVGGIGQPLYIDLAGDLRDLELPAVNPYSDKTIAWLIRQGDLKYKFTVKIDHDQLTATNDVVVSKLQVAKAKRADDAVKARLGLPLGLIVALIKDLDGNIVLHVPIEGSLKDPKFDLSDAIWSSIKNVLVNVLASPFKLIGSLFSKGDKIEEPKVNPVTFPAGSAALTPDMEQHVLRVADFMRRTPYVVLTMHAVVTPADAEALKAAELSARLQQFAKERGISDPPKVLSAYFQAKLPDEKPPKTVDEQMALLRQREAAPTARLAELQTQRIAITKDRLVKKEGIQDKRLVPGEPGKPADGAAEGGVAFSIGEGDE